MTRLISLFLKDKDPFWDPPDLEKLIGTTQVLLQPLAYNIELAENLAISDYKGKDQGEICHNTFFLVYINNKGAIDCLQFWSKSYTACSPNLDGHKHRTFVI